MIICIDQSHLWAVYVVAHIRTNAFVAPTNSSIFHPFVPLSVAVQRSGSGSGNDGSSSVGVPVAEAVVAVAGVASTTEVETVGQNSGKSNVVEGSVGLV